MLHQTSLAQRRVRSLRPARNIGGFTLVEILIVVAILGIMAAMVIPQFASAQDDSRKANLKNQLQTVRAAVQLYRVQHRDTAPLLVTSNWAAFTGKTDTLGNVTVNPNDWGPYLKNEPVNPLVGSSTIAAAAAPGVAWVYDESDGTIFAIADDLGTPFDETLP
jgi:general secretion pathway protein G